MHTFVVSASQRLRLDQASANILCRGPNWKVYCCCGPHMPLYFTGDEGWGHILHFVTVVVWFSQ